MSTYNIEKLVADLERDEGMRLKPYQDQFGNVTIGVGRNLAAKGISRAEAYHLMHADIDEAVALLDSYFPVWRGLSDPRQRVLVNMAFNMGLAPMNPQGKRGLWEFQKFLAAVKAADFDAAAQEMLDSAWAKQVGPRAIRLADLMKRGV